MKKVSLILLFFCSSIVITDAQPKKKLSKKDAEKIAHTVNTSLEDMAKSIEKMDWSSLGDLIQNTVTIIEKHTDAITNIVNSVDTAQLNRNAEKLANQIEKSVDVEKLETDLNELAEKLNNSVEKK